MTDEEYVRGEWSNCHVMTYGRFDICDPEGEMDWAVPQPRPGQTAEVSCNLPEATKSVRLANRPGRSFHTRSEVSQDFKSEN